MTTASQAPLKLPPTFANSFWASHPSYPSYRSAITHLYSLLQHGLDENISLLTYIRSLNDSQWDFIDSLRRSTEKVSSSITKEKPIFKGARDEDSTSDFPSERRSVLVTTLQSLSTETIVKQHIKVTQQLTSNILEPFGEWSSMHSERIKNSYNLLLEWLDLFEQSQDELDKLRYSYEGKCKSADEAEDDARFSGIDVVDELHNEEQEQFQSQMTTSTSSGSIIEKDQEKLDVKTHEEAQASTEKLDVIGHDEGSHADQSQSPVEERLDPVKLERRKTLRKQFGFSPRIASGGSSFPSSNAGQRTFSGSSDKSVSSQPDTAASSLRRSGTISSALTSALSAPAVQAIKDRLAAAAGTGGIAEKWKRLRREAEKLESDYLAKARAVDTLRCRLEDAYSEQLNLLQKYEVDRLKAVKTLIQAYSAAFTALNPSLASRLQPLLQSHEPNKLISHLISSARTGSYRPQTEVFHPFYHDDWSHGGGSSSSPAVGYGTGWAGFGMHLNARWRAEVLARQDDVAHSTSMLDAAAEDTVLTKPGGSQSTVAIALPIALSHLLHSLERAYADPSLWPTPTEATESESARVSAATEKRKSWIYEVPLRAAHACRQAVISHTLSSHPGAELGAGLAVLLDKFDPPTRAMTVKIWLAELQESLVPEENWVLISSLYKAAESVEAKWRAEKRERKEGKSKQQDGEEEKDKTAPEVIELDDEIKGTIRKGILEDLSVVLGKLSSPHLVVLDSLISHLKQLVASTSEADESSSVYINKLSLSLGRYLLRPPHVTHSTQSSPIPILLLTDLITHYEELIPPVLSRKSKIEEEATIAKRKMPTRKRTKPIDTRIRRSQFPMDASAPPLPAKVPVASPPKIVTDGSSGDKDTNTETEDTPTPTPIAERMLSGHAPPSSSGAANQDTSAAAGERLLSGHAPPSTSGDDKRLSAPPATATSDAGGSSGGSAYGTPTEEKESDETIVGLSNDKTTSPEESTLHDEDKPLSNVARLSRQFGSNSSIGSKMSRSGSGASTSGGVRGPRPAGGRAGAHSQQGSTGSPTGGVAALASRLQQQNKE
ncbi:unnamed protein product [Sympodiomycopsis kandeliae]